MNRKNPFIGEGVKHKMTLLKCGKYELECYVFGQSSNRPGLFIRNSEADSYHLGGDFFSYDWNIKEIKEDLIPTIDEVLGRRWGDEILGNNFTLVSAIIDPQKTYFTSNNDLGEGRKEAQQDENKHLDTTLFRKISLLWLKFLESLTEEKM